MHAARIRIPSRKKARQIDNVFVRIAVEEVWRSNRRRAFTVSIDHDAHWSRAPFNTWIGEFVKVASLDGGHGRAAKLAALLAAETGGTVKYLVEDDMPEDTIYSPGHLPLESYRPAVEWLRIVMEGPFARDEDGNPQTFDPITGVWVSL